MKTILLSYLSLFVSLAVFSQDIEKTYFENNPTLGGDVVIKSADINVIGEDFFKTFEIESFEDGTYFLDAWMMVPLTKKGIPEFKVAVNDVLSESSFKPQTTSWQALTLTDPRRSISTIKLKRGKNKVSIIGKGPEVPNVEFIRLSLSSNRMGISDTHYKNFLESIKSNTLPNRQYSDSIKITTRSNNIDEVSLRSTGGEIYDYRINIPVYYTTRLSFLFSSGQNVSISTSQNDSYEHVIELFHSTNPSSYSWTTLSSGNGSLNVTIPVSGTYYLRIRAYRQNTAGLVNLIVNGTSYPNCVVAGTGIAIEGNYYIPSNFMTCKLKNNGDTWLFLEDYSDLPGRIIAHNDDGGTKSDNYNWERASLISTNLTNVRAGLISAFYSNFPAFTCDLYLGLQPTTAFFKAAFPMLALDNSFISGASTSNYNCISWSVGKTNSWDFPSQTNLTLWDNYYRSYGYTRSGANADNAAIALWMYNGLFTHASVRKNSTITKPHGFEWESKCGSLERIMHIRDALNSSASSTAQYGNIVYYYRPIDGVVNYSLPTNERENNMSVRSSIGQQSFSTSGLTHESRFSQIDLNQISDLTSRISANIVAGFESKYLAWKKTWSEPDIAVNSNPYKYAESKQYIELSTYCSKYGKAMYPLIINKLAEGDIFVLNLLRDLSYGGSQKFIDDITPEINTEIGKPVPSLYSNLVDYSKKLLLKEQDNILKSIQTISNEEGKDVMVSGLSVNNQTIAMDLYTKEVGTALIQFYNIFGGLEYEMEYKVQEGKQSLSIDVSGFESGIYIMQMTIGSKIILRKIKV